MLMWGDFACLPGPFPPVFMRLECKQPSGADLWLCGYFEGLVYFAVLRRLPPVPCSGQNHGSPYRSPCPTPQDTWLHHLIWQREFCRRELDWESWDGEIVQDYPSGPSVLPRVLLKEKGMWRWKWGRLRFKDPMILALKLEERSISQEMRKIQF